MPRISGSSKKTAVKKEKPNVKKTAETMFKLKAPKASKVSVAGNFNGWNPCSIVAKKDRKGVWSTKVSLSPGTYEYKFVVDGSWVLDPANNKAVYNSVGSQNSVLEVK
jgi:1,4-alpha-glucan branching enzyme